MPKKITKLTKKQEEQFDEHADKWIDIGLCTDRADRPKFESAARRCYTFADLAEPEQIIWVDSPLEVAIQGPTLTHIYDGGDPNDKQAIKDSISKLWHKIFAGQLWPGGYWWAGAYTSFFREVCNLELPGDLWDRAIAYEETIESACWWYPHTKFIIVSERPLHIHLELQDPNRTRGWGSHRLHDDEGPAIVWPDGWGVWSVHGVRVPRAVVEDPQSLNPHEIIKEQNVEVRRVMIEKYTVEQLVQELNANPIDETGPNAPFPGLEEAKLYRIDVPDDEPLCVIECKNTSAEADGSHRRPWLRVPPSMTNCLDAMAWTWGLEGHEYRPTIET